LNFEVKAVLNENGQFKSRKILVKKIEKWKTKSIYKLFLALSVISKDLQSFKNYLD